MSEDKKKRIREKIGQVFQIPLGDGLFGYGQVVTKTKYAFFDYFNYGVCSDLEQILKNPVLFRITVDDYVIKKGVWPILGVFSVNPKLQETTKCYTYDFTDHIYRIWDGIHKPYPATPEEVYNLEPLTSWGDNHVERRLRDHLAGRPNYTVEYFRNRHNPNFERDIVKFYAQYGYEYKLLDFAVEEE